MSVYNNYFAITVGETFIGESEGVSATRYFSPFFLLLKNSKFLGSTYAVGGALIHVSSSVASISLVLKE